MSGFDDREKGFEAKFKLDQETQFKVTARRNKLLGLWAAAKLGLAGDAADAYAKEVVLADFEKAGDSDVIEKVAKDLAAKNIAASAGEIEAELAKLAATAREQVIKEA
ncbi:MAG TPA: DUF1476 domain-containing protein [Alphaproteobacteria bacterium]|nr:DUF1476 domain-containing protein [Alphaproteobacteria bacterium]